jgi:hypothetical protein
MACHAYAVGKTLADELWHKGTARWGSEKGWQKKMADHFQTSEANISRWLDGAPPGYEWWNRIQAFIDVDDDEFARLHLESVRVRAMRPRGRGAEERS